MPAIRHFLARQPLSGFVGGRWVGSKRGETLKILDPGTAKPLAEVAAGGAAEVDYAVTAAYRAFRQSGWATMAAKDRATILHRLADLIDEHTDTIALIESLDVGKPVAHAVGFDVPHAAQTYRYYAELAVHTRRREPNDASGFESRTIRFPCGVCAFLLPSSFPFLLASWGIAPALAGGNTVVIKPADDTPLSTIYLCRLAEEAGVPPGVVNVVTGRGETAGAALASHRGIQHMSFMGSPAVGRMVAESCGRNLVPVKLSLGGQSAAVLFEDVNVSEVARTLAHAITRNAGEVCCTATRWLVHEALWDQFLEQTSRALESMRIGYGADPKTEIGPLVSMKKQNRALGYLESTKQEGAEFVLAGGKAAVPGYEDGFYLKPALLTGNPAHICAREEIYGPVAYATRFRDEVEAIEVANRSPYGLANSVWSRDLVRAIRVAEELVARNTWINAHNIFAHGVPYGGTPSGSGGGVLGPSSLSDYLRSQTVTRPVSYQH